jgi:GntR family transcriptional regulator
MDKLLPVVDGPSAVGAGSAVPAPTASSIPLHRQIANELRRQINDGTLLPGDSVPSEHDLMRRYGVSRGTVRQALAAMRADGTIGGSQGKQLVVRPAPLTQPLSELISFSAWVQSLGKRPSGRVIEFAQKPADDEIADALQLQPGDPVFHLVRVRLADGRPLMVERTAFRPHVGRLLEGVDLTHRSIYAVLAQHGVVFASARHLLSAVPASREDAGLLKVRAGAPVVRVLRHACSLTGEPLEWSDDRYGDGVSFAIENSSTGSGLVRRLN